jgi:hypothetical protein
MKPTEDLFTLVKSLTKSEKRYFKLYADLQQGSKNYIRLFDAIYSQKEYDEQVIKRQFKNEVFIKQLSVTKNYLYKLILKSLDGFHAGRFIDSQLREYIAQADILYFKEYFKPALKILERAQKIGYQSGRFVALMELLTIKRRIALATNYTEVTYEESYELYKEEINLLNLQRNQIDFWNLLTKLYALYNVKGVPRKKEELREFEEIIKHPLLSNESNALSNKAKHAYYSVFTIYEYVRGNLKGSYEFLKKRIALYESNPILFRENIRAYISINGNFLIMCLDLKRYKEFEETLHKIRKLPKSLIHSYNLNSDCRIFEITYQQESRYVILAAKLERIHSLISEIEKGLEEYKDIVNSVHNKSLRFSLACLYFVAGKYKKSLFWINEMYDINLPAKSHQEKVARLLILLIHYELENYDALYYFVKSTYRLLVRKKELYKSEKLMLDFLKNNLRPLSKGESARLFKDLKQNLISAFNDPLEKNISTYFDFISWIDTKIEGKNFGEILKSKQKK